MFPEGNRVENGENISTDQAGEGIVRREDDPELWREIDALVHHSGGGELEFLDGSSSGNSDLGTQPGSEDGILSAEK